MTELNDVPNYVEMSARAYQTGREMAKQKGVQNALSMAATDPQGAQNALVSYGAFPEANALGQITAQQRTLKTQQDVAPQIAKGDYSGAMQTAAAGGQFDMAKEIGGLDAQQREAAQAHADIIARTAFGLSQKPADARPALYEQLKPHLLQMGFKPEELSSVDLSDQGLAQIAQQAMSVKDSIASHQRDTELKQQDEHNKATEAQTKAEQDATNAYRKSELGIRGAELGIQRQNGERQQWQILNDPKSGQPYRYNASTGAATTLDGSQPYAPTGAQKIASGTPRSATAMATQRFLQEHPDASADDLANFNADMGKRNTASKAFATGKQGQTVNSLNVAVQHLDTLSQLADAMGNGNIPLLNKVGQAWTQQTGGPAPTNFNAAKQIVADEVVKAVVGSGGGVGDRDKAQQAIMSTNSPGQLKGVIQTYTKLMGGQLGGLKLQYKNSTGLDDFETHLAPSTQAALETHAASAARPPLSAIFGH
jgi:hypothetical protein